MRRPFCKLNLGDVMKKKFGIVKFSEKIPGGMPLLAMLTTMLVNTFFPEILNIGYYTTALFSSEGTKTFIGLITFVAGAQVDVRDFIIAWKRGGIYMLLRLVTGVSVCLVFTRLFGAEGIFGISTMAFVICLSSFNPGIYLTGMQRYGNESDIAVYGPLNIWTVPTMPLLIMSLSSGVEIDPKLIVSTLLPFFLGFILGNMDPDLKKLLFPGLKIINIFLFATFGSCIDLIDVLSAGVSGLLLTVIFTVITVSLSLLVDRVVLRGKGYAGAATCAVCGAFVPSAALVAEALPQYAPYVISATAQVSMVYVITGFSSLYITELIAKKFGCPAYDNGERTL